MLVSHKPSQRQVQGPPVEADASCHLTFQGEWGEQRRKMILPQDVFSFSWENGFEINITRCQLVVPNTTLKVSSFPFFLKFWYHLLRGERHIPFKDLISTEWTVVFVILTAYLKGLKCNPFSSENIVFKSDGHVVSPTVFLGRDFISSVGNP